MKKYVILSTTNNFTKVEVLCFGHFREAIRENNKEKNNMTKVYRLKNNTEIANTASTPNSHYHFGCGAVVFGPPWLPAVDCHPLH